MEVTEGGCSIAQLRADVEELKVENKKLRQENCNMYHLRCARTHARTHARTRARAHTQAHTHLDLPLTAFIGREENMSLNSHVLKLKDELKADKLREHNARLRLQVPSCGGVFIRKNGWARAIVFLGSTRVGYSDDAIVNRLCYTTLWCQWVTEGTLTSG